MTESAPTPHGTDDRDQAATPAPAATVLPTRDDPVLAPNAEFLGGPAGQHVRAAAGWWTPLRVVLALAVVGFLAGYLLKVPCIWSGWADPGRYTHMCYSDIPPLYSLRGFADGLIPYLDTPRAGHEMLEYPVLTGMFMLVASWLTPADSPDAAATFFSVNALMLLVCLLVTVAATALTVRRRPWDAAMVALAPGVILAATINWDLLAIALTSVALALWARRHPALAGVALGLAIAAKFYPVLLIGPLFLLCLRARRMRSFAAALAGGAVAWLVVNLPFMIGNFAGWAHFYAFSSIRGEDFGSIWLALSTVGLPVAREDLNLAAAVLFGICCLGIAALALGARRRPRLAQLCFLVVAAFLLTNKVYSPQYVLWLIPLAALARPRWRDFLIWQGAEVVYYAAIWWYLAGFSDANKGLPQGWYAVAIVVHVAATAWLAGLIVRDALRPQHDPVRTDGQPEDRDDPGGGVLDAAADAVVLPWVRRADPAGNPAEPAPVAAP